MTTWWWISIPSNLWILGLSHLGILDPSSPRSACCSLCVMGWVFSMKTISFIAISSSPTSLCKTNSVSKLSIMENPITQRLFNNWRRRISIYGLGLPCHTLLLKPFQKIKASAQLKLMMCSALVRSCLSYFLAKICLQIWVLPPRKSSSPWKPKDCTKKMANMKGGIMELFNQNSCWQANRYQTSDQCNWWPHSWT